MSTAKRERPVGGIGPIGGPGAIGAPGYEAEPGGGGGTAKPAILAPYSKLLKPVLLRGLAR